MRRDLALCLRDRQRLARLQAAPSGDDSLARGTRPIVVLQQVNVTVQQVHVHVAAPPRLALPAPTPAVAAGLARRAADAYETHVPQALSRLVAIV